MAVRQDQVQVNVEINGAKAGNTIKDLETSAKQLRRELRLLPSDTAEFAAKAEELRGVNTQLKAISDTVKGVDTSLKTASTSGGLFTNILSGAASVFTGAGILGIVQGALGGIKDFFTTSVDQFKDADQAARQLTQGLEGNTVATAKLQEQAGKLQKDLKGLFDDDDIVKAQTRLTLYTKEADSIEQLTPLILDLAAAKGVDLVTAAEAVGKSVSGNADGLKKLGISVKDAGTEQERLKIISDGLSQAVGGQAKVVSESGTTGWQRFTNTLNNAKETIGGAIAPLISKLGDFLSDLFDKSEPLINVFKGIFSVLGDLWSQVKQLIGSFGLFNSSASASSVVMEALTAVFGFVGRAIQTAGSIMGSFIGALKEVVAIGSGTASAIVSVFSGVKDFFLNVFSNVGAILKGVFTLDLDAITAGVSGLKNTYSALGTQIRTSYEEGYNTVKANQKALEDQKDDQEKAVDLREAAAHGKAKATALTDAEQKKLDEAAAKKLAKEAELRNKLIELNDLVTQARVGAMQDGVQKELAVEDLRFQKEQEAFVKRINDLRKLGANETTIKAANDEFEQNSESAHLDKKFEINRKYYEASKAEKKKADDEAIKHNQEIYKQNIDSTNQFYDELIAGVRANEAKKALEAGSPEEILKIKKNAADAEVELEIQKNEQLRIIAQENGQSAVTYANFLADEEIKAAERKAAGKRAVEDAVKETIKGGLDFAIAALGRDEEARKKNAKAIKAFGIAKIAINLAEEVQAIWKGAAEYTPPFNLVIGGVATGLAIGRSILAVSNINKAGFYDGGPTGPGVGIRDDSGHLVAGVVHANEWVSPQWMTEHPMYGRVIHQLEDARVRGFADGGFTTTPTMGLPAPISGLNEELLNRIAEAVENPTRIKADVVYSEIEHVQNGINDIRDSASIG